MTYQDLENVRAERVEKDAAKEAKASRQAKNAAWSSQGWE